MDGRMASLPLSGRLCSSGKKREVRMGAEGVRAALADLISSSSLSFQLSQHVSTAGEDRETEKWEEESDWKMD